jgi:branched-chain amino acid transport system permease protein
MHFTGFIVQILNGLAEASSLFLVAAGLSLIFGVTRIVNFAHGSLYMLGLYAAYSIVQHWGQSPLGFWLSLLVAAALVAALGALIEVALLRRLYHVPEMFQLLATFALVLIINDAALWWWGPDDLLGPLAPGLNGSIQIFDRYMPVYDVALIFIGPAVLLLLWLALTRTQWGALIRAATQDREMLGALGVNQAWLFTGVFAIGSFLAGLGGALQIPRQPASLMLDLSIIGDVFVVVVVGGMGSIPGAYLAALIISELKALCVALGVASIGGVSVAFPKLTLVIEFIFMALVLVFRPWGLLGRPLAIIRHAGAPDAPLAPAGALFKTLLVALALALVALPLLTNQLPYASVVALDIIIAALFAASLHFMMGPGGMPSFGHAAYFGMGAYAAAMLFKLAGWPMLGSLFSAPAFTLLAAIVFGWFCVRLTGVYLAMLTLAFAQIVWSVVYQWDDVTGGSNGIVGIWPDPWFSAEKYYYFAFAVVAAALYLLRRMVFSPFGYALRAARDSSLRAEALGIDVKRVQWVAFVVAGVFAAMAGALFVFSKGGTSPEVIAIGKSVDGLLMVLLGGIQTLFGPVVGAAAFTLLQDYFVGVTQYWRALFGGVILLIVLVFPQGIVGYIHQFAQRAGWGAASGKAGNGAGGNPA